MGDTVVFQDEVDSAMDAAFAHGLEVTGLHNHFFYDEPKVYFMHIGGQGDPAKLAGGIKSVWDAIKDVRTADPTPAIAFAEIGPEADEIEPRTSRRSSVTRPRSKTGWSRSRSAARARCTGSRSAARWA